MIQNLRKKFVLITVALVSVVLLAVFVGINFYFAGGLRAEGYKTLEQLLNLPHGDRGPNFQLGGNVPPGLGRDPVFVVTLGQGGAPALASAERIDVDQEELDAIVAAVLASGEKRGELDSFDLRYLVGDKGGETRIAFMALSLERGQLRNVMMVSGLGVAGALVVFFVASLLLSRWALRPVEEAWQRQRRFVADASHELKTPLTVILANTNILKNNAEDSIARQMTWVQNTEEEARRMKGLVDDMLFLAKGDDTNSEAAMGTMDMSAVAAAAALAFEPVAFEQGRSLEVDVEPDIAIQGSEPQIKQLVGILLDNAVKYGETGGAVTLKLKKRQNHAELSVHNTGTPISDEAKKHLFDRFYRGDSSRTTQGYGLGLSIAKAIAENHHGRIEADSGRQGTTFVVSIPVR